MCLLLALQRNLSGSDDLQQVTSLEMCVDTRQTVLGNFGKVNIQSSAVSEADIYFIGRCYG